MPTHDCPPCVENVRPKKKQMAYTNGLWYILKEANTKCINLEVCDRKN